MQGCLIVVRAYHRGYLMKYSCRLAFLRLALPVCAMLFAVQPIGHAADVELADLERISTADTMLMMPMRDGVRLATDIYRPKDAKGKVPVIFIKTPYDFNEVGGASLQWTYQAVSRGYAVAIQNERGRYYSEGEWELLGNPRTDGYDALTWLEQQPWSNGNIGTVGCSSSAEWQLALAALDHPAHKAMIPMAGLTQEQLQRLRKMYDLAPEMPEVDWIKQLRKLPAVDWLDDAGGNTGPFRELMSRKPVDPAWYEGGLYHDNEDFGVPAFWWNSWFDVSQGPNLALYNHVRSTASDKSVRDGQYVLIAPTLHCGFYRIPEHEDLIAGELNVGNASYPVYDQMFTFFDYYLKGNNGRELRKLPRVQFYTMGKNAWESADAWPPRAVETRTIYLESDGAANSLFGNGRLSMNAPTGAASDSFTYDPMNPVPALGGGVCCNKDAAKGGSFDQRGIEARADVLVYTSEPLEEDLQLTGHIRPTLYVSSNAKDTDFTVKLVDVHPDGTAYNVDDTIFRARYREGYDKEVFMSEGEVYELKPTPMSTSYQFKKGHRLRVEVASSKFP